MIPFEAMPGIPGFSRVHARRGRRVLPRRPDRRVGRPAGADVRAQRGEPAVVAAGQQAGLWGTTPVAHEGARGGASRGDHRRGRAVPGPLLDRLEDHDLNEIAQATILRDGAPRRSGCRSRRKLPAGGVFSCLRDQRALSRIEEASEGPPRSSGVSLAHGRRGVPTPRRFGKRSSRCSRTRRSTGWTDGRPVESKGSSSSAGRSPARRKSSGPWTARTGAPRGRLRAPGEPRGEGLSRVRHRGAGALQDLLGRREILGARPRRVLSAKRSRISSRVPGIALGGGLS